MSTDHQPPATDEPVGHFSQCHVGIVSHLHKLGQLPTLIEPMRQAREIAAETVRFFHEVVLEHHSEEEHELFPAVTASALGEEERLRVKAIVDRLTGEHRNIESRFAKIEPALKKVAKGEAAPLDAQAVVDLVADYEAHARFEEETFLPLSQTILGRNGDHMAALGWSLHLRRAVPDVIRRFGYRI